MQFKISKNNLLKPLQAICSVIERNQSTLILNHVFLKLNGNQLCLIGTDLEVEINFTITLEASYPEASITLPARKLMDICRMLEETEALIEFQLKDEQMLVLSGKSRFRLSTLSAVHFPSFSGEAEGVKFVIPAKILLSLFQQTYFAIAQKDVRSFFNGALFKIESDFLTMVATNGHRLALMKEAFHSTVEPAVEAIIPRKGILECQRLLADHPDLDMEVWVGARQISFRSAFFTVVSKLIHGSYPVYQKVIPKKTEHVLWIDRDLLKSALARIAILSNEKFPGVRLEIESGLLKLSANNPEQERAEEEIFISYEGNLLQVSFNIQYLVEILNVLNPGQIKMSLTGSDGTGVIEQPDTYPQALYVLMPIRL